MNSHNYKLLLVFLKENSNNIDFVFDYFLNMFYYFLLFSIFLISFTLVYFFNLYIVTDQTINNFLKQ